MMTLAPTHSPTRSADHSLLGYVGPDGIRRRAADRPPGTEVRAPADLQRWLTGVEAFDLARGLIVATYVVDGGVALRLANRRVEHVVCAGGEPVLAAGELTLTREPDAPAGWAVTEISNQSTGYCPPPSTWDAVALALDRVPLPRPAGWTLRCEFARCADCGQQHLLDGETACLVCGGDLVTIRDGDG